MSSFLILNFKDTYLLNVLRGCRDAADLVVQGKGKFEELMVCSHEIAASTAQLVAASKVSEQCISIRLPLPVEKRLNMEKTGSSPFLVHKRIVS